MFVLLLYNPIISPLNTFFKVGMFVGNYAFEQTIEDLASITSQPCFSKWARIPLTVQQANK